MRDGKTLKIARRKGGDGTTTLALNGAYAFARRGWQTLLVDADPQRSNSYPIGGTVLHRRGLIDVLEGSSSLANTAVTTRLRELDLLPIGSIPPTVSLRWAATLGNGDRFSILFSEARDRYDVVLVDTPPTLGGVAVRILRAADYVVSPRQAEPLAARSVSQLLAVLGSLRTSGARIELPGTDPDPAAIAPAIG